MITFTADQLRKLSPVAKAEIIDALVDGIEQINAAGIDTPLVLQHFLVEVAVETGGFKAIEENLFYTAERLTQVWPSRFPSVAAAKPFAKNPQKLANKVYGGRLGNRLPNDGWDFRGSSMIQTTGRDNFRRAGYEKNPDLLRQDAKEALKAALKFWVDNDCTSFAERDDIVGLRKRINGGSHGLDQARNYLKKAKTIFLTARPLQVPLMSKDKIQELQERLIALGYVGVGKADGYIGAMTIGAISAFQAENGLKVNGQFDTDTRETLKTATPRPLSESRANSEPENSRILSASRLLKKGAVGILGAAGLSEAAGPLSALEMIGERYQRLKSALAPFSGIQEFFANNPIIVVAGMAGIVYLMSKAIEKARIEDHQTGRTA